MDIFDKIIAGQIPSHKIFEDELCVVILDIAPIRKGHSLVISKKSVDTVCKLDDDEFRHIMGVARRLDGIMREKLGSDAVNIMINDGRSAGQEVPHVHVHVIPRKDGDGVFDIARKEKYSDGEAEKFLTLLKF